MSRRAAGQLDKVGTSEESAHVERSREGSPCLELLTDAEAENSKRKCHA